MAKLCSRHSVGDSYDNAQAESVWSGFKRVAIHGEHFVTKAEAHRAIFSWIVSYLGLHTSIGNGRRSSTNDISRSVPWPHDSNLGPVLGRGPSSRTTDHPYTKLRQVSGR